MRGDGVAQSYFYEALAPLAYRVAHRVLRNSNDAEDVAQDAILKAIQGLPTYDERYSIRTWVARISRNTAIDLVRKRRKLCWAEAPDSPDTKPLQDEVVLSSERKAMIRRAMAGLPPMYKQVIDLHHFQDLKYREIASELEVPIGTVMNRLFRARQKMKTALTQSAA